MFHPSALGEQTESWQFNLGIPKSQNAKDFFWNTNSILGAFVYDRWFIQCFYTINPLTFCLKLGSLMTELSVLKNGEVVSSIYRLSTNLQPMSDSNPLIYIVFLS